MEWIDSSDLKSQISDLKGGKRTGTGVIKLGKKPVVEETKDRGVPLWDILHDSVLLDLAPDLENNRITLYFDVRCVLERLRYNIGSAPEIMHPDVYDREVLFKFIFEEVSELIFMAGGPEDRVPEKRNIKTTRNMREFIENLKKHTLEILDAKVVFEVDGQSTFSLDGQLESNATRETTGEIVSYYEAMTIKYKNVRILDPEEVEKTLEEMTEIGRKYWEKWSRY